MHILVHAQWPVWQWKSRHRCLYLWGEWDSRSGDTCWSRRWKGGRHRVIIAWHVGRPPTHSQSLHYGASETMLNWRPLGLKSWQFFGGDLTKASPLWAGSTLCNPSCFSVMYTCLPSLRIIIVGTDYRSLSPSSFLFLVRTSPRWLAKRLLRSLNHSDV